VSEDDDDPPPRVEAERILALCGGDALRAFDIVQSQHATLVLRTQVMLSLSGIVITVTGFSGRAIAETSARARVSIVLGLVLVLLAAAVLVAGVLRLKWLTQALREDTLASIVFGLELRNRKAKFLSIGLSFFVVGFSLYVLAVAQLLVAA
jgi:hypothetical protein